MLSLYKLISSKWDKEEKSGEAQERDYFESLPCPIQFSQLNIYPVIVICEVKGGRVKKATGDHIVVSSKKNHKNQHQQKNNSNKSLP